MSKRQKLKNRAERRRAEREQINAAARESAVESEEKAPPRKNARHARMLDLLKQRGSISPAMFEAACRFEVDFHAAHAVLGNLIIAYEPRFRTKKKSRSAGIEDGPAALDARRRVEGAISAAGPLADLLISVVIFDEPVAQWATVNGFFAKDGAGAIRITLQAVCDYYGKRQPRHLKVSPPAVPADLRPPEPQEQPEPSGPEAVAEVQRQGGAAGNAALAVALKHVAREGWLLGGGERRDVGLLIAKLAAARWPGDQVAAILSPPAPPVKPKMLVTSWPKAQKQAETAGLWSKRTSPKEV